MVQGTAARVLSLLQEYDLHEETSHNYRCNSPLRPGSNSQAFTLHIDDAEHGAFFDHVSGDKGSLYDLARALGIEISPVPVASSKRAYTGIADYAAAHGLTADELRAAGWRETTHQDRPALEFKTKTGPRWRYLDGVKPYYTSGKNYQRSWYGLNANTGKRLAEGHDLVLCNGEISVVAARSHGLAVACVTAGEKSIPADLLDELKVFLGDEPVPIIVAFDCDPTGLRAGRAVAAQLREVGLIAKAVNLGLSTGGDLADFCQLHGADVLKELRLLPALSNEEIPLDLPAERSWSIVAARDLKNLPPLQWIVPGEIPEQCLVVLYGESGAGKSFVGLDYALRIAQERTTVYIPTEGEWGYAKRVAAWCAHHHKEEGNLLFIFGAVSFFDRDSFELLMADLTTIRPALLVVDTLAMAMAGGDENSSRDMGIILKACRRIQRTLGCTVMLIHHVGKSGVSERGSTALRGGADVMIRVNPADDLVLIECSKTKDEKPFPARYMKLLPVGDSLVPVPADKVVQQTANDPLTKDQRKLLDILALEVNRDGASIRDLAELTGISLTSVQRALSNMLRLEFVQKPVNGPYSITDQGRQILTGDPGDPKVIQTDPPVLADDPGDPGDPRNFEDGSPQQELLFGSPGSVGSLGSVDHLDRTSYYGQGL